MTHQVHCSQLLQSGVSERARERERGIQLAWQQAGRRLQCDGMRSSEGEGVVDSSSGCELLLKSTSAMADDSNENIFLDRPSPSPLSSQNHQADCLAIAFAFHSCALTHTQTGRQAQTDRRQKSKVEASITDNVCLVGGGVIAGGCFSCILEKQLPGELQILSIFQFLQFIVHEYGICYKFV